jgi:hypothetical protein
MTILDDFKIMYELPKQADEKHDFAFSDAHGGEIHISNATKSGRLDYVCLGCKKPMQAILRKLYGAKPYFRHDTKDVVPGERCTFRDEEYRRKLALTTIDLEKMLYVPALHKFPPKGVDGPVIPLAGGHMIYASRVTRYQYIYEDEAGAVKVASAFDPEKGTLLFFADLVLYDEDEQPILLVTLERPKKKDMPEVQAALARLRINTLYLTIPQESPEAIHRSLMNGKNAKWLYHDDERQFDYLSLSAGFTGGVPAVDGDPGQLFEESFDCRKVQINNLIRVINKCLGAEPYRKAEQRARAAVGKTGLAITRAEEQRDDLVEQHRARLEEQYQSEFIGLEERRRLLELAFSQLRDLKTNLEARYRTKNGELEEKGRTADAELRRASLAAGGTGRTIDELESDLTRAHDQAIAKLGKSFGYGINAAQRETRRIENSIAATRTNEDRLRKRIENLPDEFGKIQAEEEKRYNSEEESEDSETTRVETARDRRPATFTAAQGQIDAHFNATYPAGDAGLPAGFDHILSDGPLNTAAQAHRDYIRLRKAKEFLESPAFQAWASQHQHR